MSIFKIESHGEVGCWLTDADRNIALPFWCCNLHRNAKKEISVILDILSWRVSLTDTVWEVLLWRTAKIVVYYCTVGVLSLHNCETHKTLWSIQFGRIIYNIILATLKYRVFSLWRPLCWRHACYREPHEAQCLWAKCSVINVTCRWYHYLL